METKPGDGVGEETCKHEYVKSLVQTTVYYANVYHTCYECRLCGKKKCLERPKSDNYYGGDIVGC